MVTHPAAEAGESRDLLLYDGRCGLCDGFVRFVARRDRNDVFRFAPLQSPVAARRLAAVGAQLAALPDTVVLLRAGRLLLRSAAALQVLEGLGGAWRPLARALALLPVGWRDRVYDLVAGHRARLFGRRSECRLPDASQRTRFLWD
jgi:predicted DCC family thiol-disulfide oxidoreductase YuxK